MFVWEICSEPVIQPIRKFANIEERFPLKQLLSDFKEVVEKLVG